MNTIGILWYVGMCAAMAAVVHGYVRDYARAVILGSLVCAFANLLVLIATHDPQLVFRIANLAFWYPMIFMMGLISALPTVVLVGLPFCVIRGVRRCRGRRASIGTWRESLLGHRPIRLLRSEPGCLS